MKQLLGSLKHALKKRAQVSDPDELALGFLQSLLDARDISA